MKKLILPLVFFSLTTHSMASTEATNIVSSQTRGMYSTLVGSWDRYPVGQSTKDALDLAIGFTKLFWDNYGSALKIQFLNFSSGNHELKVLIGGEANFLSSPNNAVFLRALAGIDSAVSMDVNAGQTQTNFAFEINAGKRFEIASGFSYAPEIGYFKGINLYSQLLLTPIAFAFIF